MRRYLGPAFWLAATAAWLVEPAQADPARRVLEAAASALRETRAIEYRFETGAPDDPMGWASGQARLRQVSDTSDSWLYVGGVIHAQPRFGVAEQRFEYAADGARAYFIDHTARTFQSADLGGGGNSLSVPATYGFVTDFIESRPLWKELEHSTTIELRDRATVDGGECDVVRVEYGSGDGASVTTWWFDRSTRLPRRGEWTTAGATSPPFAIEFRSIATGQPWKSDDFVLEPPAGYERRPVEAAGVGRPLPPIVLSTPSGETVRLDKLTGQVLVLDFWNTWCYICRTQTPEIAKMAFELEGDGVRFFGVNVFETGDPVAYWTERDYTHTLLLAGDDLAYALDLPYQPGIAVVGPDGRVVFSQLGGSADRAEKVRRAIASTRSRAR